MGQTTSGNGNNAALEGLSESTDSVGLCFGAMNGAAL